MVNKMKVIAISGAPGVGKSFLVKQLGCLNKSPSFFEGEQGVFTQSFLSVMNREEDSEERYNWLLGRYEEHLKKANKILQLGISSYIDGGYFGIMAWRKAEIGEFSPPILDTWLERLEPFKENAVIVLTMDEDKLVESITSRGRKSEQSDFIIERALRVQRASIKLAEEFNNVIVIDRTNLDFSKSEDLLMVQNKIDELIKDLSKKNV
jgi:deoxyadenosine/deoxycytidine kinase